MTLRVMVIVFLVYCVGCTAVPRAATPVPPKEDMAIWRLDYQDGAEAVSVLNELLPVHAHLMESGSLVITGSTEELGRAREILDGLDKITRPDENTTFICPLKNARAVELAVTLKLLFPRTFVDTTAREKPPEMLILADERTNALVISGPAMYEPGIRNIVEELDKPAAATATAPAGKLDVKE